MMKLRLLLLLVLFAPLTSYSQWEKIAWGGVTPYGIAKLGTDVFCATETSGVYRSQDNGLSWTPFNQGQANDYYFMQTRYLFTSGDYLYRLTPYPGITFGSRMYRVKNGSSSWEYIPTPLFELSDVWSINSLGKDTLAVGMHDFGQTYIPDGIYFSTDAGFSWKPSVTSPISDTLFHTYIGNSGRHLCASFEAFDLSVSASALFPRGIFRTSDLGVTWLPCKTGLPDTSSFQLFRSKDNVFYAAIYQYAKGNTSYAGLYTSTDFGATWAKTDNGIDVADYPVISLTPYKNGIFASTANKHYFSSDTGKHWVAILPQLEGAPIYGIVETDSRAIIEYTYGIFASPDLLTPAPVITSGASGIIDASYLVHDVIGSNVYGSDAYYTFGGAHLTRSTDNGFFWEYKNLSSDLTMSAGKWAQSKGKFYAGGTVDSNGNAAILRTDSPDNSDWKIFSQLNVAGPATQVDVQGDTIVTIAGDASSESIFLSFDNGFQWYDITPDVALTFGFQRVKFFGKGGIIATDGFDLYISRDIGLNWNRITDSLNGKFVATDLLTRGKEIFCVGYLHDANNGAYQSCVFISTDEGHTWDQSSLGLPPNKILSCGVLDAKGNIFVSTDAHSPFTQSYIASVFSSSDMGSSWNAVGDIPNCDRLFAGNKYLFGASDYGFGLFRILNPLSGVTKATELASNTSLSNYPNPFTSETTISFTLLERGAITLDVYDLLGNKITRLANDIYDAGVHTLSWNGSNVSAGTYFLRLHKADGDKTEMVKITR